MSPFIIFAIVLTIAEILYFSAAIYMELHAKSRKDGDSTENIPIEDEDDSAVVRPRTVTENAETGGFDITGTSSSPEQEQITEADETDITAKAEEELLPASDAPESTGADNRPLEATSLRKLIRSQHPKRSPRHRTIARSSSRPSDSSMVRSRSRKHALSSRRKCLIRSWLSRNTKSGAVSALPPMTKSHKD